MPPINVAIVEDNDRFAGMLARLFSKTGSINLAARYATGEEALGSGFDGIDVAILDIGLPGMSGIELVKRISASPPAPEILMLTAFEDEEKLFAAMQGGASGYVVKDTAASGIVRAVEDVAGGGTVISPRLAKRFYSFLSSNRSSGGPLNRWGLEKGEIELLSVIARGLTNAETGRALGIERRTVRTVLGRIYAKMGTCSRVEAVTMAINSGLLSWEGNR